MLFVIRMLRIGWGVLAHRDWATFPNEWAILRPSTNGIIWKHLLEKKVRVGLRFGARPAVPSPADISLGACCQSCLVSFFRVLLASLIEFDPRMFGLSLVRSRIKSFAAFETAMPATGTKNSGDSKY